MAVVLYPAFGRTSGGLQDRTTGQGHLRAQATERLTEALCSSSFTPLAPGHQVQIKQS